MSKRGRRESSRQNQYIAALVALVVVVIIALVIFAPGAGETTRTYQDISPNEYVSRFTDGVDFTLLDVRRPEELAESGYIDGMVNIPLDEEQSRLSEIRADIPVVVYCRSGNRSGQASVILADAGYEVYDLGGIDEWQEQGYPVVI